MRHLVPAPSWRLLSLLLLGLSGCMSAYSAEKPAAEPSQSATPLVLPINQIFALPDATTSKDRLSAAELAAFLDDPANHRPILPVVPIGLDGFGDFKKFVPAANPITRAKVELGRQLYFDPRLSRDGTVSCASCHDPEAAWATHTRVGVGINNQEGGRNSPTVFNRAFGKQQFWDGRAATLEEQALGPIQNPVEMGFTLPEVLERLQGIQGYRAQFEKLFGGVSADGIAKAIASFERVVLVAGSPYDFAERATQFAALDAETLADDPALKALAETVRKKATEKPLSAAAARGKVLFFGKANCSLCHVGANFTDEEYYNLGVGFDPKTPDEGRAKISKNPKDLGAYKTPTLRNVAQSAPYMHDGSEKTLLDVVEYYDKGGTPNPNLHTRIKKLNLNPQEKADLVAFMEALTGEAPKLTAPKLPQ